VREGTCGRRHRQLVSSGIRASNCSGELTGIILLKCLYTFLQAVHNQQTISAGFPGVTVR